MTQFNKIIEQIKNNEIKFYGSDVILNKYDVNNINHLTCATIINYLENESNQDSQIAIYEHAFECLNTPFTDSLTIEELLDTDKESYELCYDLESQRLHIWLPITITFPKYENEDYEKYIEDVIKEVKQQTDVTVGNFDPEDYFEDVYFPGGNFGARESLLQLDKTKEDFITFSENLN
jgi:hypothetical protein